MNIACREIYSHYFKTITASDGKELKTDLKEPIKRIDYMLLKVYNRTVEVKMAIKDINNIQKYI